MACTRIRAMNSRTPTPAITVYWRFRYAEAPSCTAPEAARMRALPADSPRRCRRLPRDRADAVVARRQGEELPRRDRAVHDGGGRAHERDQDAVIGQEVT